jgi:hypothetical protein
VWDQDESQERSKPRKIIKPEILDRGELPNLSQALDYLKELEFDSEEIGFVFELNKTMPVTFESLKAWSEFSYECKLVAIKMEDGLVRSFFQTGGKDGVNWAGIAGNFPEVKVRKGIVKWLLEAHNHPNLGEDYPSVPDAEAADVNTSLALIIFQGGITVYGNAPEYPTNLPEELKERTAGKTTLEILKDIQMWAFISEYIQDHNPSMNSTDRMGVFYQLLGVPIKTYSWSEKEEMDRLIKSVWINN